MQSKILLSTLAVAASATEKIIFEDNFDKLDFNKWQHEITMGGGGNWEFEYYTNNRTNSFVEDGVLHLQPTFLEDTIGENAFKTGTLDLWGSQPADTCTGNAFWGCSRSAPASGNYLNPIQSARLRSVNSFNFKYGRAEIRAKLPKGDWLWPAIWFLPKDNAYGQWPASGEIDLVESRGNSCAGEAGGSESFGTTLHWGPDYLHDAYEKATKQYKHTESLGNDFHIYGLDWSEKGIISTIDGTEVMNFPFDKDMWTQGGFPEGMSNPWRGETEKSAPFNQPYYLIFNVAVGGTLGYFPDGQCAKPWDDKNPHAVNQFWDAKDSTWGPTWKNGDSAMQIDYVKIYQDDGTLVEEKTEFLN